MGSCNNTFQHATIADLLQTDLQVHKKENLIHSMRAGEDADRRKVRDFQVIQR